MCASVMLIPEKSLGFQTFVLKDKALGVSKQNAYYVECL